MKNIKGQNFPIHSVTTFSQISKMFFTVDSVQHQHYSLGQCHSDFLCHLIQEVFTILRCKIMPASITWDVIMSSFPHI